MSTIASPRNSGTPAPQRTGSLYSATTPTSSARPSLDTPRSTTGSPNSNPTSAPALATKRNNRAALREYYNLKRAEPGTSTPPSLEVTDVPDDRTQDTPRPSSHGWLGSSDPELDSSNFDADAFVARAAMSNGLADLLGLYARVLGEMRALDAERKALVYDNYSKLISATETIRRMRANMDPLNPLAGTLDPAMARIYEQASDIRDEARTVVASRMIESNVVNKARERTRELAEIILKTPDRLRRLVAQNKLEEARKEWELPRRILLEWKQRGLGGEDVGEVLEDGDAALPGHEAAMSGSKSSTD